MWMAVVRLAFAAPGNRNATISAGEGSGDCTGPALTAAARPATPPTPKTAKQANTRLFARRDRHPIPDTPTIELRVQHFIVNEV
jgi:hypothetical protein